MSGAEVESVNYVARFVQVVESARAVLRVYSEASEVTADLLQMLAITQSALREAAETIWAAAVESKGPPPVHMAQMSDQLLAEMRAMAEGSRAQVLDIFDIEPGAFEAWLVGLRRPSVDQSEGS
jgi:hypothetical protein